MIETFCTFVLFYGTRVNPHINFFNFSPQKLCAGVHE